MDDRLSNVGQAPDYASLTDRERELLRLWAVHGDARATAHAAGIAYQTYKNHVTLIIEKLSASSMGHAALMYDRWARVLEWPEVEHRVRPERRSGQDRRGA